MNVLFSRAGCFSLLCRWLVVNWTPVVKSLADDEDVATRANSLEEENVWFRVVYFVVFPAQALESRSVRGHHCEFDGYLTHLGYSKASPLVFPKQLQGTFCWIKVVARNCLEHRFR